MLVAVPGRTELAGNHTDHQGGHVLAAAVDLFIRGDVEPRQEKQVLLSSKGFGEVRIDLTALGQEHSRPGTAEALARGVLEYLGREGWEAQGFYGDMNSAIPAGAGLSSSAAFSVWVGRAVSRLFYADEIPPMALALAARYAENRHFGKPCGLMDQCACAFGGVTAMSFREERPSVKSVHANFRDLGYALCVVQTGGNHADLTEDYALITREMGAVAAAFGKARLSEVDERDFIPEIPSLRKSLGDRAVLRALHYFEEDRRAVEMAAALEAGDMRGYLTGMDASGRSSAELLQNSCAPADPRSQGISLALALSRRVLWKKGAARVHGGGFAGTVQALMPLELEARYRDALEAVFGPGSCLSLDIVQA